MRTTEGSSERKSSVVIYDGNGTVAMLEDVGCPYPTIEENPSSSSSSSPHGVLQYNNHDHGCSAANTPSNDRSICGMCLYEIRGGSKTIDRLTLLVSLFNGHYWRYEIHLRQPPPPPPTTTTVVSSSLSKQNHTKPVLSSRLLHHGNDDQSMATQSENNAIAAASIITNQHHHRYVFCLVCHHSPLHVDPL
jgi:hypothetical protein